MGGRSERRRQRQTRGERAGVVVWGWKGKREPLGRQTNGRTPGGPPTSLNCADLLCGEGVTLRVGVERGVKRGCKGEEGEGTRWKRERG